MADDKILRRGSMVLIMIFCMTVSGCAASRYFNASSDEDMKKFRASKDDLWTDLKRLKQENEACQLALQGKQEDVDQLRVQVLNLTKRNIEARKIEPLSMTKAIPAKIVKTVAEENVRKDQATPREEKRVPAEERDAIETAAADQGIKAKVLKVKVLSGNGKIASAKAMSERLTKLGYKVADTSFAHRSNFAVTTVYYAPDYKREAQRLVLQLGGGAVFRPLSWSSVFHVIVVAGP
jgi:hypothetical protein